MDKETIKNNWKQYKLWYIGGTLIVAAGVGGYILNSRISSAILPTVNNSGSIDITNSQVALGDLVYKVEANRQGPPSWVVQCLETGDVYSSQNKAAEALKISSTNISKQLNNIKSDAEGYHFRRICLSA